MREEMFLLTHHGGLDLNDVTKELTGKDRAWYLGRLARQFKEEAEAVKHSRARTVRGVSG